MKNFGISLLAALFILCSCENDKENENKYLYAETALELGFDVELDIWAIDGKLYLGKNNEAT